MKRLVLSAVLLICGAGARAVTSGDVVISPENTGVLVDKFFYDFKINNNPAYSESKLDDLFVTDGFNGVRTPIWGNINQPAHPTNGVVIGSYYSGHVNMILEARERNPDLIVFASKKLNGDDSFPDWVKDASGVIPDQYAILLADYIEYMATQGITIDVLGIDNEERFNEGNITPERHKDIVDELELLAAARSFPMPEIIGPEDFDPDRNNWMEGLITNGWGDRLDIYGTHYYARWRPIAALQSDLAWAGTREKWHTELHWDQKDADDMYEAEISISAMWDCIDNGMNGLMWWSYSRSGFRGSIMKDFSAPLIGAQAVAVDDADGADILTTGRLQTRAFLRGNTMTVFAINVDSGTDYSNLLFRVDSGYVIGDVEVLQWTSTNDTAGAVSTVSPTGSRSFEFDIPDRSLSRFTFTFAPSELFAHYAFEKNLEDHSPNHFQGLENGPVVYPPGRDGFALSGSAEIPMVGFEDFLATFWLKTDAAGGALLAGPDLDVSLLHSNVVFTMGGQSVTSYKPLNDGCWHQVAVERTFLDGGMKLYVDGRLEAYGTGAVQALSGTNLTVGGIAGLIDELRIYDRPFGASDLEDYDAPSVLLTVGGAAEERGPVDSFVAVSACPAGADYPYIDLVEDDGSWVWGYAGTSLRAMSVGTATDPVLLPNIGSSCFTRTTDAWWRGVCKLQFDDLVLEAGTYTLSFYVGDADTNYLFYAVHTDPETGNH
uniref:LamG-like jellyroll fold domain-containing protein n=1 Tax=Pontiella sp. TaxID=2837462 RepID=UPI003566217B